MAGIGILEIDDLRRVRLGKQLAAQPSNVINLEKEAAGKLALPADKADAPATAERSR